MKNGDQPAFSISYSERTSETYPDKLSSWSQVGLTKREYFAAMAMQGLISDSTNVSRPDIIAEFAVQYADELLKQLEK
jgi:hypothetical protein